MHEHDVFREAAALEPCKCPDCGIGLKDRPDTGEVARCPRCRVWLYESLWAQESFRDSLLSPKPCSTCGSVVGNRGCDPCRTERRRQGVFSKLLRHFGKSAQGTRVVSVEQIDGEASGLRQSVDVHRFERLRRSIAGTGLLHPIVVRPLRSEGIETGDYAIVDGLRRWLAIRHLGLNSIPVQIIDIDRAEAARWRLAANLHREALGELDEAETFVRALEGKSITRNDLAASIGIDSQRLLKTYERYQTDRELRESWTYRTEVEDSERIAREDETLEKIRLAVKSDRQEAR